MTRSLRWAGVGLCAMLLPACKGVGDSNETTYASASPALVVVNRPAGQALAGSREQLTQGLASPGSNAVAIGARGRQ